MMGEFKARIRAKILRRDAVDDRLTAPLRQSKSKSQSLACSIPGESSSESTSSHHSAAPRSDRVAERDEVQKLALKALTRNDFGAERKPDKAAKRSLTPLRSSSRQRKPESHSNSSAASGGQTSEVRVTSSTPENQQPPNLPERKPSHAHRGDRPPSPADNSQGCLSRRQRSTHSDPPDPTGELWDPSSYKPRTRTIPRPLTQLGRSSSASSSPAAASSQKATASSEATQKLVRTQYQTLGNFLSNHFNVVTPGSPAKEPSRSPSPWRPGALARDQNLLASRHIAILPNLLATNGSRMAGPAPALTPNRSTAVPRKLWVRKPGASPTLIHLAPSDLVDDVRDKILFKYANSLGRTFDAPDISIRVVPREPQRQERVLSPEEDIVAMIEAYYPGGQSADEALIIETPLRRTPRASPRAGPPHAIHLGAPYYEDSRPNEAGTDYFGPSAIAHLPVTVTGPVIGAGHPHALSVLSTGQIPQVPSPGSRRNYRDRPDRPRLGRQHTSSPTIINMGNVQTGAGPGVGSHGAPPIGPGVGPGRTQSNASSDHIPPPLVHVGGPSAPPTLPTPPIPDASSGRAGTPPRVQSPRPRGERLKKKKPVVTDKPSASLPATTKIPPINVLIVEDNSINLNLLVAFLKKLRVRWQTAVNGREAVDKWRRGGFHLVLMDIQLPVMSGLEATREIRRLERVNNIGVFSNNKDADKKRDDKGKEPGRGRKETPGTAAALVPKSGAKRGEQLLADVPEEAERPEGDRLGDGDEKALSRIAKEKQEAENSEGESENENDTENQVPETDRLDNRHLFLSPVIIVALTANSLQSDRHEALAAGCNDFLTKPVKLVYLQRKVTEWGCMQALIDYEGWRKWKHYGSDDKAGPSGPTTAGKTGTTATSTAAPSQATTPARASTPANGDTTDDMDSAKKKKAAMS